MDDPLPCELCMNHLYSDFVNKDMGFVLVCINWPSSYLIYLSHILSNFFGFILIFQVNIFDCWLISYLGQ